jgi:hypothetical protein
MNLLFFKDLENNTMMFTPTKLLPPPTPPMKFKHPVMPTVHPVMGKTISCHKNS